MPTFTQAILLGADRLAGVPELPHPSLHDAWRQLDWNEPKEAALLEASAIIGTARRAAGLVGSSLTASDPAPSDSQPLVPPRAVAVLRQLLTMELRALLPEWMELCAARGMRISPFYLPALLNAAGANEERTLLLQLVGERGRWLARQNPQWGRLLDDKNDVAEDVWDVGSTEERLAGLRYWRRREPARATRLLAKTWSEDAAEFRVEALALFDAGLSLQDEPLLTQALADRRKDVRVVARNLLAKLPGSGLSERMRSRAATLLMLHRGLLGRKLEVNLPATFDPAWKVDGIEEKPPAGVGEKAYWTQQILATIPVATWRDRFDLDVSALVALAAKSDDWGDLLLGGWFGAACVHGESELAAALIPPLFTRPKALPAGLTPQAATAALLRVCDQGERWRLAGSEPQIAWTVLPLLTGTPTMAQGRALFDQLRSALRDGFNPGGSPVAVIAARCFPPSLRDEAAHVLSRDNGLSKPAEAFLQALELRAELHAAFSSSTLSPSKS